MKFLPDELLQTAAFVMVGVLGGAVKYLRDFQQNSKKFSLIDMLIAVFTGGFLGMQMFFLCTSMNMSSAMTYFMSGVVGLMGDEAIKLFVNRFKLSWS
ncbi:hypothetical protein C0J08_15210 [Marinomonas sp. CT5]|uniref:phage holin family protein n=1 Tax=Marinomonas sp. CT5 TaxID=2066133 RepID=UPI0017AE40E3|nr:phage holin family protein [Marinomonas sp. CT5]NVK75130.1 phage holin family protein [Oceanospirillaceae bacterium]QUX96662.1 hypothetical protein C0J08_15210 [Marinomonas sp. CT5]